MRTLWLILIVGIAIGTLVGCNRRGADPLEWRVQGRTPLRLQNWVDETISRMTPELAKEYSDAVVTILNLTPRPNSPGPDDATDPVCRRLDQRTVREIIIEADELEINEYRNKISNEYTNLTRFLQMPDLTAKQTESLERRKTRSEQYIKQLEQIIVRKNARIAELTKKS